MKEIWALVIVAVVFGLLMLIVAIAAMTDEDVAAGIVGTPLFATISIYFTSQAVEIATEELKTAREERMAMAMQVLEDL